MVLSGPAGGGVYEPAKIDGAGRGFECEWCAVWLVEFVRDAGGGCKPPSLWGRHVAEVADFRGILGKVRISGPLRQA